MKTLASKFVLLVVLSVGAAVIFLSLWHIDRAKTVALASAEAAMAQSAASNAKTIELALTHIADDARILSNSPALQAVLGEAEADVGSTLETVKYANAKSDLSQVFETFMGRNRDYAQIRLIGRRDDWKELVRVNRSENGLKRISPHALQSKGDEPYLAGIDRFEPGQLFFTPISLNVEHGQISGPPMLRLVAPVFSDTGEVSAAIVMNIDANRFFADLIVAKGADVTVITQSGDHITIGRDIDTPEFVLQDASGWTPSVFSQDRSDNQMIVNDDAVYYAETLVFRGVSSPFELRVVTHSAAATIFAPIASEQRRVVLVSIATILLAMLASYAIARKLTEPLSVLSRRIIDYENGHPLTNVPIKGNDELASLAASFIAMGDRLALRNRELVALFDGAATPIITLDMDDTIQRANRAAEETFGYDANGMVGLSLCDIIRGKLCSQDCALADQANGCAYIGKQNGVATGIASDGTELSLSVSFSVIQTHAGQRVIGILTDITAQIQAEEELAASIQALQRSNEELDQLAYVASHDMRAPLRVIENAATWLEEDLEEHLTEDTRETLSLLRNRTRRMSALLDDLLEHARVGREHESKSNIGPADIEATLRDVVALPDGFTLDMDFSSSDIALPGVPITTVLLNLIQNAIKHHDRDAGKVSLSMVQHPDEVVITVADDGPGIAPDYHHKVFEMFQTLKPKDEMESSGMGLALVQKHVRHVGGTIALASDGGRGCTFTIHWPTETAVEIAA